MGDFDSQPLCQPDLQQTPTLCTQFACTFCALASALFLAPLLHPFRLGSLSLFGVLPLGILACIRNLLSTFSEKLSLNNSSIYR